MDELILSFEPGRELLHVTRRGDQVAIAQGKKQVLLSFDEAVRVSNTLIDIVEARGA
ncbi:hypothetical protein [Mycobacterium antarcticum]|uniref:hypothetical protein n=1 Tax=Mycolicibacterium sp. TUM20984 TaxID=3023368 RepID=UPI0024E070ED|nr:hypothetical protein [Mycolicibacterium sp. TUM20984]